VIPFQRLSAATLIAELRRYADDIQSEGRTNAPECMREAARRLENIEAFTADAGGEPTESELLEQLRTHAPALIVRGLFASSGAVGVAFADTAADTFEQRWDELLPEARSGWARLARLIAMCPQLFADVSASVGELQ
jgi:hypothetical protein